MLKVQFGCGGNHLEGFFNHDAEVPIEGVLPYPDGVVDFVFASHVFEHVNVHDAIHFLQESHRILKPGGVLRLCVPTLERIQDRAHGLDLIYGHGHKHLWAARSLRDALWAAGFDRQNIVITERKDCDSHWKVIGKEKDDLETCRMEATK